MRSSPINASITKFENLVEMVISIKGLFKRIKRIFPVFGVWFTAHKEQPMQIGHPTDVKHVLHVGLDNLHGSSPSWMSHYKPSPDFPGTSLSNLVSRESSWVSHDFDQSRHLPHGSSTECPCSDLPTGSKKAKQLKSRLSSLKSSRSSSRVAYSTTAYENVGKM